MRVRDSLEKSAPMHWRSADTTASSLGHVSSLASIRFITCGFVPNASDCGLHAVKLISSPLLVRTTRNVRASCRPAQRAANLPRPAQLFRTHPELSCIRLTSNKDQNQDPGPALSVVFQCTALPNNCLCSAHTRAPSNQTSLLIRRSVTHNNSHSLHTLDTASSSNLSPDRTAYEPYLHSR